MIALRGMGLMVLCVSGWIAMSATDAFAVAGKFTSAPPGAALSGGELTLELDQPVDGKREITVPVDQQGHFTTPAGVEERNIRSCRYTNNKGETTSFRCGGYLAFGGGAAAAAAAAGAGWSAPGARDRSSWAFDGTAFIGGTGSLGGKDATTTGTGTAVGQGTSGLEGLGGATFGLMLRTHLPLKVTGPLGDVWGFVRWNQHSGRAGQGGSADLHLPVNGNESSTSLKRYSDIEVGIGKSFTTYCQDGDGPCQYIGVYVGYSAQRNKISVNSNEIVRAPNFENTQWKHSVVTGAWYQIPLAGIGTGLEDYSLVFGADFRRVPCMSVDGATILPATYRGQTDSFWEVTTWGGLNLAF